MVPLLRTLLEMDHGDGGGAAKPKAAGAAKSKLPSAVQDTIKIIFDNDMFKKEMKKLGVDTDKMPLGKLSKDQVTKGEKILESIEKAIQGGKKAQLDALSSEYSKDGGRLPALSSDCRLT
eukprot:gene48982-37258_t